MIPSRSPLNPQNQEGLLHFVVVVVVVLDVETKKMKLAVAMYNLSSKAWQKKKKAVD